MAEPDVISRRVGLREAKLVQQKLKGVSGTSFFFEVNKYQYSLAEVIGFQQTASYLAFPSKNIERSSVLSKKATKS